MKKNYRIFFALTIIFFSSAFILNAQDVLRQGTFAVEEVSVTEDINGSIITPPLAPDEGMVVIKAARNNYFNIQDVARWLRNGDIQFNRLNVDLGNVGVRNNDEIQFRFKQNFIGDATTADRRMQIRHPEGHFENYFEMTRFYRQQVVALEIGVDREPQFPEEFVPTGTLEIFSNEEDARIQVITERGIPVEERIAVDPAPGGEGFIVEFTELQIGSYRVQASKEGMRTVSLRGINVENNSTTIREVEFERDDLESGLGRIIVNANLEEVEMEIRDERGNQETRTVFGFFRDEFAPGVYILRFSPAGHEPVQLTLTLEEGETIEEDVIFRRTDPVDILRINSNPQNATVTIDGEAAGRTPLVMRNFPREEKVITLSLERHRSYTDTLMLQTEDEFTFFGDLEESYMRLATVPQSTIYIDGEVQGTSPIIIDNPEQRLYEVRFERENYASIDTTFDLSLQDVVEFETRLSMEVANVMINPSRTAIPITISVKGPNNYAETFEGVSGPALQLGYGEYEFEYKRAGFKTVRSTSRISEQEQIIRYDLEPKSKVASFGWSALVPGAGQLYWGQGGRSALVFLAFAGAAGYTTSQYLAYTDMNNDYKDIISQYNSSSNPSTLSQLGSQMETQYAAISDKRNELNLYLIITAGVYGLNLLDRLLVTSPGRIYATERDTGRSTGNFSLNTGPASLGFSINF
ncbi:MAG: PEGA domain-containing protein [Balneolaceae bacterium]